MRATRLPAGDLYQLIKAFRNGIATRTNVDGLSQRLYALLLKPLPGLDGVKRMVVVPSGPLHYLPFAALTDGKRALLGDVSILTLPSLSILQLLRSARPMHDMNARGILAFGNPDLGSSNLDLPTSEVEVVALAKSAGADVLVRRQASKLEFLKRQSAYRILHFATHGEYDTDTPLKSALRLAAGAGGTGELRAEEILQLRVNADLVTMSACETGLGFHLRGDELIGLNRAWLFAGVRNIVASLWNVDDDATSLLMGHFYRFLEETDVENALRLAQLEVRKTYPSPFFWGAFYVSGGGGAVKVR